MRRRGLVPAMLAVFVVAMAQAAAPAATALDGYLDGLTSWSASFTQSVVDAQGKPVGKGSGSLTILRPGRFRWELAPEAAGQSGQLLLADGKNLWFYDRDLDQVTVKPMDAALAQTPAMLLSGTGQVRDAFEISAAGHGDGLDWVQAVPRKSEADFRLARFGFLGGDLRRLVLEDKLGQRTTLVFDASQRNRPVDPSRMVFTPPQGVDVIGTPVR